VAQLPKGKIQFARARLEAGTLLFTFRNESSGIESSVFTILRQFKPFPTVCAALAVFFLEYI
jgi:orotate phosphoribosyltransferase